MQNPNYKKALTHPIFSVIRKASKELDVQSFVIGGFVRDFILKRGEAKDIDVVAIGSGINLALKVAELLPNKPKVCLLYTSPSPRDRQKSRMPSSA